jgi:hypothetical protein
MPLEMFCEGEPRASFVFFGRRVLMHCPQCGRPMTSADVHFCKHCGFALDGVKELLIPSASDQEKPPSLLNIRVGADPRSLRGVNQAAYLMILAFAPLLLAAAQGLFGFTWLPAMLLMKGFFALLTLPVLRFGYALYEAKQEWKPKNRVRMSKGTPELGLPSTRRERVAAFGDRRMDTAEIVPPPSVTESTTELLRQSQDEK